VLARTTHVTLLERLSAGEDRSAWREFCDRYGDLIRGFARRAGCSDNDADDVLQDALMALVRVMPSFRYDPAKGRFRGYLKTIVVRALAKKRCQNDPTGQLEEGDAIVSPESSAHERYWEEEWRQYHVRLAMRIIDAEFSVHDRAAFQRYALEGQSVQQTAKDLGLSIDHVYQAKSRILRRLGEIVTAQVADEG
jgi:RNA polymerase sigma-70 factor, ECF subfamily